MNNIARAVIAATAVAGTLDILSAFVFGGMAGATPGVILRYVASGPFGDGLPADNATALLGLAVHFALMAIMATVFVLAAARLPALRRHAVIAGLLYGLAIYLVMYFVVVPARFGKLPTIDLWHVGNALFSHWLCVGLPIALIARRYLRS